MIGKVTRVDGNQVHVIVDAILPGIEMGPLPAVAHRVTLSPDTFSRYRAGDTVLVVEDTFNDFIVIGVLFGVDDPLPT